MKPRPLYRSLTFWSGILVLGFIAWAYWDSKSNSTSASIPPYTLASTYGTVVLWKDLGGQRGFGRSAVGPLDVAPSIAPLFLRGGEGYDSRPGSPPTFRDVMSHLMKFELDSSWILLLPHGLLLFAVALPWSLLLFWRARRIKKAIP